MGGRWFGSLQFKVSTKSLEPEEGAARGATAPSFWIQVQGRSLRLSLEKSPPFRADLVRSRGVVLGNEMKRRARWHGIALWALVGATIMGLAYIAAFVRP